MLSRHALQAELIQKSDAFRDFVRINSSHLAAYLRALQHLADMPIEEAVEMIERSDSPGAVPSPEVAAGSFNILFGSRWNNHEQARTWAADILSNRTTFAADGSQIYAAKQTSVPVAAIQIGWFENPHAEGSAYQKNTRFEILTPAELLADQEEPMNPDIRVEERRYLGEVGRIKEFLRSKAGWKDRGERMPVAFLDDPLLVPFSQKGLQRSFLDATVELLQVSLETRVPLIGYVDRSFARDILTMLDLFGSGHAARETGMYDAALIRAASVENWGDRTCFFYAKRRGLDAFVNATTGRSSVGFIYLQTTSESAAARIDVPSWIYEDGLLEEVVDVVRAECVIGLGYPYALETADQAAVISPRDREVFFRALQEFASREKLDFSVARKDASKARRR